LAFRAPKAAADGLAEEGGKPMADGMSGTTDKASQREAYRKASLLNLNSPERLNEAIAVTRPTAWFALVVVAVILVGVIVWSVIGRLPTHLSGNGMLLAEGGRILEVNVRGNGTLRALNVRVGDQVQAGQVIGEVGQTDAERELRAARETVAERSRDLDRARVLGMQEATARRESIARQREALELRGQLGQQREQVLRQRLRQTETLFRERIVTQNEVLTLQQELAAVLQEISNTISERARLGAEELELGRMAEQRVREAELALAEATRRTTAIEDGLQEATRLIAPVSGQVTELRALQGAQMRDGQAVLAIENRGTGLEAVAFIGAERGKRVTPGMTVRVAPSTVRREEHGTLIGRVISVSDFPVTFEAVRALVQNDDLARSFMEGGPPHQVVIALERDPSTASGYRWTSSRGVGVSLSSGTALNADITVELRRPIGMVIPALRDIFNL
jgi:HlyD family secretion protein